MTEKTPSKSPATFSAPIYVPPSPPKQAYLPPDTMQSPNVPGSHFLPTVRPEDTLANMFPTDLQAFPSHINSSFLPPELDSIKNSIDSSNPDPKTFEESSEDTTYTPPKNLYNFPPNVGAAYLPPRTRPKPPESSYLPIPSGDDSKDVSEANDGMRYETPEDLNSFPPNIGSVYPKTMQSEALGSSFLSSPSGNIDSNYRPLPNGNSYMSALIEKENVDGSQKAMPYSYAPVQNPFNFPPNVQSSYLPPGMRQIKQSVNSYLPPASGSVSGFYEGSKPTITDVPQMNMAPPADMMDMAPPSDMMNMAPPTAMDVAPPSDDHHHHHSDHPPW